MPELHINKISDVREISAQDDSVTIGRSSENLIVLASNGVSRHHCVIEKTDEGHRLRDLDSRHGSFVNGERVSETALSPGDVIRIGRFEIEFVDPNADPARADAPTGGLSLDGGSAEQVNHLRHELETERAAATELRARLEAAKGEVASAREAAREESQKELEAERDRAAAAETAAAAAAAAALEKEQRARADDEAEHERKERELREQGEAAERDLREKHESTERELRERIENIERELREFRDRYESAERESGARGEEITRLTRRVQEELERAESAERSLDHYDTVGAAIKESTQRLTTIQGGLEEVERLWLEIDELASDLGDGDEAALDDVLRQREMVANQLEAAHAARDDALAELYSVLDGFRRLPSVGKSVKRSARGRGLFSPGRIIGSRLDPRSDR